MTEAFELNAGDPVWAPDGKTVYFSSNTRESVEIFGAEVASGTVRQLTEKSGVFNLGEISANGQTAVGTRSDPEHPAELFRCDLSDPACHESECLAGGIRFGRHGSR